MDPKMLFELLDQYAADAQGVVTADEFGSVTAANRARSTMEVTRARLNEVLGDPATLRRLADQIEQS